MDSNFREDEAVRRLLGSPFMLEELLDPLGLSSHFRWALTKVPHERLVGSFRGDVDVLMGPLRFTDASAYWACVERHRKGHPRFHELTYQWCAALELAALGGLVWPPSLNHLVALETKCARYKGQEQQVRSDTAYHPKERRIGGQVNRLLEMGFNRVALLDFITNPPMGGSNGQAWLNGVGMALRSKEDMLPRLETLSREADGSAGHAVFSWAAVSGGDETTRGGGCPTWLRLPADNPLLGEPLTRKHRAEMEGTLQELLAGIPHPVMFPVIIEGPLSSAP